MDREYKFIHLLYVPTMNCNMQCKYCYLKENTVDLEQDEKYLKTLEYAVEKFKEANVIPFNISLHGGEVTTLSKIDFRNIIKYIADYYDDNRKIIEDNGFKIGAPHIKTNLFNLEKHIENVKKFGIPVVVCINKFDIDADKEIKYIKERLENINVKCEVSTAYENGSGGATELAKLVCDTLNNDVSNFKTLYDEKDDIKTKIEIVSKEIYGAKGVKYSDLALEKIASIEKLGYGNLPICVAKTPASLSDDAKLLGRPTDFYINVKDVKVNSGAGFVVIYTGNIMTMPGLGKKCKYEEF